MVKNECCSSCANCIINGSKSPLSFHGFGSPQVRLFFFLKEWKCWWSARLCRIFVDTLGQTLGQSPSKFSYQQIFPGLAFRVSMNLTSVDFIDFVNQSPILCCDKLLVNIFGNGSILEMKMLQKELLSSHTPCLGDCWETFYDLILIINGIFGAKMAKNGR